MKEIILLSQMKSKKYYFLYITYQRTRRTKRRSKW